MSIRPFQVVLLDIEGTTTPISFVYEVLFPFARANLSGYLVRCGDSAEVTVQLAALEKQSEEDRAAGLAAEPIPASPLSDRVAAAGRYCEWLMDSDRKVTPLKALQGQVWRAGYASGELQGALFDDVAPAFTRWSEGGVPIYIYSSGSVEAQRLLFGASVAGDLTAQIAGYFDTNVGHKRVMASYQSIAATCGVEPGAMLFLTDVAEEATAATAAGMQAAILDRPGNHPQAAHDFTLIQDFTAL